MLGWADCWTQRVNTTDGKCSYFHKTHTVVTQSAPKNLNVYILNHLTAKSWGLHLIWGILSVFNKTRQSTIHCWAAVSYLFKSEFLAKCHQSLCTNIHVFQHCLLRSYLQCVLVCGLLVEDFKHLPIDAQSQHLTRYLVVVRYSVFLYL